MEAMSSLAAVETASFRELTTESTDDAASEAELSTSLAEPRAAVSIVVAVAVGGFVDIGASVMTVSTPTMKAVVDEASLDGGSDPLTAGGSNVVAAAFAVVVVSALTVAVVSALAVAVASPFAVVVVSPFATSAMLEISLPALDRTLSRPVTEALALAEMVELAKGEST